MRTLFRKLICVVLFSLIDSIPQAYCTAVYGLKIDLTNPAQREQGDTAAAPYPEYLHKILEDFQWAGSASEVDVELRDEIAEASLVDTDTEDIGEVVVGFSQRNIKSYISAKKLASSKKVTGKYNRSRSGVQGEQISSSASDQGYTAGANYMKADCLEGNFNSDKLRTQLALDALQIVESDPQQRVIDSTACLCVALRDKHEYVKKFVFHNKESVLPPAMRQKAHALGYDVIQAEQSHAEGQLIQFLLRRNEKRPGWYTHILGMGCSRQHCIECDSLFKAFLGSTYTEFTTATVCKDRHVADLDIEKIPQSNTAEITDESDKMDFMLRKRIKLGISLAQREKATDTTEPQDGSNYYLSQPLKEALRWKSGKDISFCNRFTKSKKRPGEPAD